MHHLRSRRSALWLATTLAILLILTLSFGCAKKSGGETSDKPVKGGNLVIGVDRETDTFDLYQMTWSAGQNYVYDTLVTRDWDYKYAPGLAESWEVSSDGLTWTFHLQKGVKWQDGTPFTSKDVKQHFVTMIDPATAAANALDYSWITSPDSMETPDDYTIIFHLKTPFPNLLFKICQSYGAIQSPAAYAKYGPNGTKEYGTKIAVGTGSLKLKEWIPDDRIVLERNPDYNWGAPWLANRGPFYLDTLTYRLLPDSATRVAELETGNVQVLLNVPVEHYDRVSKMPNVQVIKEPAFGLGYLAYNIDKKPFNDVRVRQAINLAIDRAALAKSVFFDLVQPAYGYLPPGLAESYEDKNAMRYDVEAAKKLLADAGYPNGFTCTLSTQNRTEHVRAAQALQPMLEAIGIKAEIVQYDEAGYGALLKASKQELFMREYSWDNADILQWFLESRQAPYPGHSHWKDAKTDQMIAAAENAVTPELRTQGYIELEKHLIEKAVWCPLWYPLSIQAIRTDLVGGYRAYPGGGDVFNDVWLKKAPK